MNEQYPIRQVTVAVVSALGVCTLIVTQWILPTVTASANHKVELLTEENVKLKKELDDANRERDKARSILKSTDIQKDMDHKKLSDDLNAKIDSISRENNDLKDKLFQVQSGSYFTHMNPYPIGLDEVRIGDKKQKIADIFGANVEELNGRLLRVKLKDSVFSDAVYSLFGKNNNYDTVDGISFRIDNYRRYKDKLPEVPKHWIEKILRRNLGDPFVIGIDKDCLLWRVSEDELVYYIIGDDALFINGYHFSPAGCQITDEQSKLIVSKLKQEKNRPSGSE